MKITNVNDYVDKVHELFPELTKDEVKRILIYGWKLVLLIMISGNDVVISASKMFVFIGRLYKNSLYNFENYCTKLARRIRYMFHKTKSLWDGYYYFGILEDDYKEYLKQSKKTYKIFKNIMVYKLLEECKISQRNAAYIFRVKEDLFDKGVIRYFPELKTKNAELIILRDPLNIDNVMISKNKYKYIQ